MKPFDQLLAVCPNFFVEVIESLPDGLIITDRESVIAYVNDQTCAITGYSRSELLGRRSYEALVPASPWPQMQARLRQRLAGAAEEYELEVQRKDGAQVWVSIKGVPFVDEEGQIQGTIGSLRDISARRHLEGENEYLRQEFGGDLGESQLLGQSPGIAKVLEQVATVGPTDVAVLITGESGTGQGAGGQGPAPAQPAQSAAPDPGQLRRGAQGSFRERILRPRARGLHRGGARPHGPLRAGRRGHPLPRRGGGDPP